MMKKILIVDDDRGILLGLKTLLGNHWEILAAPDAFFGIKIARSQELDLLIVDLFMPGIDGVGMIHEIRSQGVKTPIILISASQRLAAHARGLGIQDYLPKPFEIEQLESLIEKLLGKPAA